jgi:hypothetical protein
MSVAILIAVCEGERERERERERHKASPTNNTVNLGVRKRSGRMWSLAAIKAAALFISKEIFDFGNTSKKLAAPKGVPERSPSSVLTGPCDG